MVAHKTEKVWKKCFPNLVLNLVPSFESCHESCHESCPVWHLILLRAFSFLMRNSFVRLKMEKKLGTCTKNEGKSKVIQLKWLTGPRVGVRKENIEPVKVDFDNTHIFFEHMISAIFGMPELEWFCTRKRYSMIQHTEYNTNHILRGINLRWNMSFRRTLSFPKGIASAESIQAKQPVSWIHEWIGVLVNRTNTVSFFKKKTHLLSSTVGQKSKNIVVTHPPTPLFFVDIF